MTECVRVFEERVKNSPDYVATTLTEHGMTPPAVPDLHFAFFSDGGYGIVERNTNFLFRMA